MALYPASNYARRRRPNRGPIYIILALVIIAGAILLFLRRDKQDQDLTTLTGGVEAPIAAAVEPEVVAEAVEPEVVAEAVEPEAVEPPAVEVELEPEPVVEVNLPEVSVEPPAEPNSKYSELIDEAVALINTKPMAVIETRDKLNNILLAPVSDQQRAFVKSRLSELSQKWLFDRNIWPGDHLCKNYRVKPGDLLSNIGKEFKVPYEILMEINNIRRAETLQAGQTIKVINGPFHARIHRSTFTMDLYLQNTFVRSFTVGLGKPGMETPTGLWLVKPGGKLIKPRWTDPVSKRTYEAEDPDYPLGSRWIALEGLKGSAVGRTGFAIHGTKEPGEIGSATSQGCIRLHNGDAILVYNLLMPDFSQVEVVE